MAILIRSDDMHLWLQQLSLALPLSVPFLLDLGQLGDQRELASGARNR